MVFTAQSLKQKFADCAFFLFSHLGLLTGGFDTHLPPFWPASGVFGIPLAPPGHDFDIRLASFGVPRTPTGRPLYASGSLWPSFGPPLALYVEALGHISNFIGIGRPPPRNVSNSGNRQRRIVFGNIYIYIYIYIERERERDNIPSTK